MTKHLDGRDIDKMLKLLGVEAREGRAAGAPKVIAGDDVNEKETEKIVQGKRGVKGQAKPRRAAQNSVPLKDVGEYEGRDSKPRGREGESQSQGRQAEDIH